MIRRILRITICTVAVLGCAWLAHSEDVRSTHQKVDPPKIMLRAATTVTLGDQPFSGLTIEVVNPNIASLTYTGYAPQSFDPPIEKGRIAPLFQIELQRDGKWEPHPIGRCLTGVTDLELTPKSSVTFDVGVPVDEWQAIKVGFGQLAGWSDEEVTTTTIWSAVFTREEFAKLHEIP